MRRYIGTANSRCTCHKAIASSVPNPFESHQRLGRRDRCQDYLRPHHQCVLFHILTIYLRFARAYDPLLTAFLACHWAPITPDTNWIKCFCARCTIHGELRLEYAAIFFKGVNGASIYLDKTEDDKCDKRSEGHIINARQQNSKGLELNTSTRLFSGVDTCRFSRCLYRLF